MSNQRVIVLSDIHADLEAFIICLRDCAQVIKKQNGYEFIQHKPDADLLNQLHCSSVHHPDYADDLHYHWVGGDTLVVIVGDLIDGAREDESVKKSPLSNEELAYYPQVEIKLLRFINALNLQAAVDKGKGGIIKVLGNHDYENFKGNTDMMESYVFTPDRANDNYYLHPKTGKSESRYEYFQFGHDGYKLYQETLGMYLFYHLDNMLFIHGQLPSRKTLNEGITMQKLERINELLRKPFTEKIRTQLEQFDPIIEEMLWSRTFGDIEERGEQTPEEFEIMFKQDMIQFTGSDTMRLFIGHCQQHTVHAQPKGQIRTTLSHLCSRNEVSEVYDNKNIYKGPPDSTCNTKNKTFGIVTECFLQKQDGLFQPQLFKMDIGMSRGQEYIEEYKELETGKIGEVNYFRPKAPQVVELIGPNMRIHRCTMRNMVPHMDRNAYKMLNKPFKSAWDTASCDKKFRKSPRKNSPRRASPKKHK